MSGDLNIKQGTAEEFYEAIARHAPCAGKALADYMEAHRDPTEEGPAMTAMVIAVLGSVISSCITTLEKEGKTPEEADLGAARAVSSLAREAHRIARSEGPTVH